MIHAPYTPAEAPASEPSCAPSALQSLQERVRTMGAPQHDPVGWHYIETLAARATQLPEPVRQRLDAKREQALNELVARHKTAETAGVVAAAASGTTSAGNGAGPVDRMDVTGFVRSAPGEIPGFQGVTGLQALTRALVLGREDSPKVQQFRQNLGKLLVKKQVSLAMAQAPQNAGPINSHNLVLRSLALMQSASPDYLNRFMGYVDTLLWLEEATPPKPGVQKSGAKTAKKQSQ